MHMVFDEVITEASNLTTGYIDLITGIIALLLTPLLFFRQGNKKLKISWIIFFICVGVADILGFFTHVIIDNEFTNDCVWIFTYIGMYGIALSMFCISLLTCSEFKHPKKILFIIVCILTGLAYIASTIHRFYSTYNVLIATIFIIMLDVVPLCAYILISIVKQYKGALFIILGALPIIIGSIYEISRSAHFKLIFEFDYNGIFHITLLIGLVFLFFAGYFNIEEVGE